MNFASSKKETVRHQFDAYCKKILREEKIDFQRNYNARMKKETLFSEMQQAQIDNLRTLDKYPSDMTLFRVKDIEISVSDSLLADALGSLSSKSRDIILLSYFLELSDTEIAKMLKIVRRTVQYRRISSLNKMKKHMER
ncbi:MAG: sigma-70 family RNA polymerase sigma factor [Clostridia bacterium]|nr:sigma-70 family RNA polymerase sigma factor [Clostridia bacterium]